MPGNQPDVLRMFRESCLVLGLGVVVFLATGYCIRLFPAGPGGITSLWLVNGLPLAALLRIPTRQWPALIAAAFVGNLAADYQFSNDSLSIAALRSAASALQFSVCAFVLRRRFGDYFELTQMSHLAWLGWMGGITSMLHILAMLLIAIVAQPGADWAPQDLLFIFAAGSIGLFILALPVLAVTARGGWQVAKFDAIGLVLLGLLIILNMTVFGTAVFAGIYVILPVLMLLAWRHGLLGGGIGSLVTIILAIMLSEHSVGAVHKLGIAGYGEMSRGFYLVLFFSTAIVMSVLPAIVRARQRATEAALAAALEASENRAALLAQSEALALEAKERLRTIIETSTDIICTLDKDGRFMEISANCEAIWGWRRDQLLGRPCFTFMHPGEQDRLTRDYERRRTGVSQYTNRNHFVRPDGTIVPMLWSATWIEQDQVCHCVGRDMTEYDALEKQAHAAQRLEAIGQLTGGIAHDFNNLLTIVIGSSETLAEALEDPERRMAEMILKAAKRGGALTKQLLAFARRQPLEPRVFNVNELIEGSAPLIRRALSADIDLTIKISDGPLGAFADPSQTEAALLNLCINARDAMPQGGSLTIEAGHITLTEDYAALHPEAKPGDYAMIAVSDTGTGIAPELIERIFEPFFTTKETGKGSGLGLSMVYGFVRQSQGHLELSSELGRGTRFTLYLPAASADQADMLTSDRGAGDLSQGDENVLVVDDDGLVREHVGSLFESLGYHVVLASNGDEALAVLEERDDIDLLFTDVVMPGSLNGRQLAERALSRWPRLRVLYSSGYAQDTLTRDGRLMEGVALLSKPYSKLELATKARSILDEVF